MSKRDEPTIFDDVTELNPIFLIDTSGSMYSRLHIVKQHLKEYLLKMAFNGGCKFNLIEFNSSVRQWSDEMVRCLPETVTVASDWISSLEAQTGTNTESALLAAYNDDQCDGVYLVTDGLPDSNPSDILDRIAYVCNGRPCHCIYLTGPTVDKAATNFLQDLATDTFGSFSIVTVTNHGTVDRISPVYKANHSACGVIRTNNKHIYSGTQKQCSVTSTLDAPPTLTKVSFDRTALPASPYALPIVPAGGIVSAPVSAIKGPHPGVTYPSGQYVMPPPRVYAADGGHSLKVPYLNYAWAQWYQPYLWSRYRTARSWLKLSDDLDGAVSSMSLSPAAGALLIDRPVLARRTEDGFYYRGRVKSQIATDRFLVEFAPCTRGNYQETSYQETFVFDIVQLNDSIRHSVMKGDKVLAPTEDNPDLYCPGTVIEGQEGRETDRDLVDQELVVLFCTGRSISLNPNKAIWVDQLLYDRTAFEIKLPKRTRKQLAETVAGYPEDSLPGYPVSGPEKDPEVWELPRKYHVTGTNQTFSPSTGLTLESQPYEDYRPYIKDHSQKSCVTKADVERRIPGTDLTEDQLRHKVGSQIDANRRVLRDEQERTQQTIIIEQRRRELENRAKGYDTTKNEIDRDIDVLEVELKYKMKLRDQALDRKKKDIDSEIELKIRERDHLMEERRLLTGYPSETRLSRARTRHQETKRSPPVSPRSFDRSKERSQEGYRYRSRSRSLSTERAPSYGHHSPRYVGRSRSLSPGRSRSRSVNFDERMNSQHHYYKYGSDEWGDDSGFMDDDSYKVDSSTNTPIIRNGRELKLKKNRNERPPWKYWKADPVPDVMDPPLHEPYSQSAVAEPLELRDTNIRTGVIDWGSSHFNKVVPNGRTNYDRFLSTTPPTRKSVSFQTNTEVHVAPSSNLVTYSSRDEKKLRLRQNASQRRLETMTPATYYMNGDSVGPSMQDFHRERVAAQMERGQQRPASSYLRQLNSTPSSSASTIATTQLPNRPSSTSTYQNRPTPTSTYQNRTTPTSTYQNQLNSTSYRRELDQHRQASRSRTPEQNRIASMSARREQRDMLHAAQLHQQEVTTQNNLDMKRARASSRDAQVTSQVLSDMTRQRPLSAAPMSA